MYLSEVHISGFRNLREVVVRLDKGLNVLVGPNSIGKSNVFAAIRHALGPAANQLDPIWLSEDDLAQPLSESDALPRIAVSLFFEDLSEDERAHFWEVLYLPSGGDVEKATAILNFEALWDTSSRRFKKSRWGGSPDGERTSVPQEVLESLPIIFLPALRDAQAALTPGNRSALARVLDSIASRSNDDKTEDRLVSIFANANEALEKDPLIQEAEQRLRGGAKAMAGRDYSPAAIRATEPEFRRILRTLRLALDEAPVSDLMSAGLGYSNLLYFSTLLSHLETPADTECPVLLIEEPEAHLSPQLTVLLAKYLSRLPVPQVFVSSHSPTFASNVRPSQVLILSMKDKKARCAALRDAGMSKPEERQLQRMMDITRATLYFARSLILVEGISEALLIPSLAGSLGHDLTSEHVSVLPICGVSFATFHKIFHQDFLQMPIAIVSDADPPVRQGDTQNWKSETPEIGQPSPRLQKLQETFKDNESAAVFASEVTLEYDLAAAGPQNPLTLAQVWEASFEGTPRTLRVEDIQASSDSQEQALLVWRGICRAKHSGSKAEFANLLAEHLQKKRPKADAAAFSVPTYLEEAILHVLQNESTSARDK